SAGEVGFVRIWERTGGREISVLPLANAVALTYVGGGKMVACATAEGNVSLWAVGTGKKHGDYPRPAEELMCAAIACAWRTLLAASAQDDGIVRIWELETGKERGVLQGHKGAVHCVAFSPDGLSLATGGADGVVIVWRQSGDPRASLQEHQDAVRSVAYSSDG